MEADRDDRMVAAVAEAMERIQPALKRFDERKRIHDALDKVGWLPHPSRTLPACRRMRMRPCSSGRPHLRVLPDPVVRDS